MSAFQVPEYVKGDWFEIEDRNGETHIVPTDYFDWGQVDMLKDGDTVTITYRVEKIGARLSAPGYLDCTDWDLFDTLDEAKAYIRDTFEVDPDTGEELGDEEESEEA